MMLIEPADKDLQELAAAWKEAEGNNPVNS